MFDGEVSRPIGAVKLAANTKVHLVIQTPSGQAGVSWMLPNSFNLKAQLSEMI
jgi:hypothetical protein